MADSLREVSVGLRLLRLRLLARRVEPNRERASALHSRRDPDGAHALASLLPGLLSPAWIQSVG
jgi:hypothetical protein